MYTPLMLAKNLDIETIPDKSGWKNILRDCVSRPEETMRFLWADEAFLNKNYHGPCERLNRALLGHRRELYKVMTGDDSLPSILEQDEALARESVSMFLTANIWGRDKEVFRFDAEMELALADCEEVRLPVRVLDRLPYNCFYIEFAENGIFRSNFHGCLVMVVPCLLGYVVTFQRVKETGEGMFGRVILVPDESDGTFLFTRNEISAEDGLDRNKDWTEFSFFALNALLYLCAENSAVHENETTKKTYRPGGRVKHKFSEIRKWDCEFRIASDKKYQNSGKDAGSNEEKVCKVKNVTKAVTPHTRRAHWHHYWTGKGRTTLSLRWIAPVRVGGKAEIATIHKKL